MQAASLPCRMAQTRRSTTHQYSPQAITRRLRSGSGPNAKDATGTAAPEPVETLTFRDRYVPGNGILVVKQTVATVVMDQGQVTQSLGCGIWITSIDRRLKGRGSRERRKDTLPARSLATRWFGGDARSNPHSNRLKAIIPSEGWNMSGCRGNACLRTDQGDADGAPVRPLVVRRRSLLRSICVYASTRPDSSPARHEDGNALRATALRLLLAASLCLAVASCSRPDPVFSTAPQYSGASEKSLSSLVACIAGEWERSTRHLRHTRVGATVRLEGKTLFRGVPIGVKITRGIEQTTVQFFETRPADHIYVAFIKSCLHRH
ncbi:hypothetical protein SAMN05444172_9208 [Burkholderia sp. GAS332]|nr:hypothetical protein SAMN05444172_9208 [Burkholderia sp. GAS332]